MKKQSLWMMKLRREMFPEHSQPPGIQTRSRFVKWASHPGSSMPTAGVWSYKVLLLTPLMGLPRKPLRTGSSSGCTILSADSTVPPGALQEGPLVEVVTRAKVCVAAAWVGEGPELRCALDLCSRPRGPAVSMGRLCCSDQRPPSLSGRHSGDPLMLHAHHSHRVSFTLGSRLMERPLSGALSTHGRGKWWSMSWLSKLPQELASATATFLCHVAMPDASGQGRAILHREAGFLEQHTPHRGVLSTLAEHRHFLCPTLQGIDVPPRDLSQVNEALLEPELLSHKHLVTHFPASLL